MKNKIAYLVVRILLGLSFIFYGVSKFLPMPQEVPLPPAALDFMSAMVSTGYMWQFVGLCQIIVGLLLLANFWVPFAMVLLAPIMANIILFNVFLAPSVAGILFVGIPLLMQVYIMYCTWNNYKPLFVKKVKIQ